MPSSNPSCGSCKSEAKPLDRVGDAEGFDCPKHGKFKVAGSAVKTMANATEQQFERALERAKARTKSGELPVIMSDDFL